MSEATVPKRPRIRGTTGAASSVSEPTLPAPAEASHVPGNPDGATPESVLMRKKRITRLARNFSLVLEIRRLCANCCMADPGQTLDAIADVLASKNDSEDEAAVTGRIMLPAEDVVGFDQQ